MNSKQKIVRGVGWSTVALFAQAIYGFISVPILLHYFGNQQYGIIGLATSINFYMQIMDLGLNSTNVRFFSAWLAEDDYDKTNRLFQTSLAMYSVIAFINTAVILILSQFSGYIFNLDAEEDAILKTLLLIIAFSCIVNWLCACLDQLIAGTENVAWLKKRALFTKTIQFCILFSTIYFHLSISFFFFCSSFVLIFAIPLSIWKIRKEAPFVSFLPKIDMSVLKEILPYFLSIFSFSIFQYSFDNLRVVLLGMQGTVESITDFRIMNGMVSVVATVGGIFLNVLLPSTSRMVAKANKDAIENVTYAGSKYISIILCFCSFGMMSVAAEMITIYVGKAYLHLLPWFCLWLFCVLNMHTSVITSIILAGTRIQGIAGCIIFCSCLGLVLTWLLIPEFQAGGTVLALCVYVVCELFFYYVYYWPKKLNVRSGYIFFRLFLPYVITGGVLAWLVSQYIGPFHNTWLTFFVKGASFAIAYAAVCALLMNSRDWEFFRSILKKHD